MDIKKSFFGGALKLGGGQAVGQASKFVKNIILARLISPENFAIAAILAMTFGLIEMASNVSVQSLIVQAPDGDSERFVSAGHLLLVFRGVLNACVLLILAAPFSMLFGVPQARWAFYCIALLPLLNGVAHLDMVRVQRQMEYAQFVLVGAGSNLIVMLLAWPLAAWLRDYSAMLWLLVLQSATFSLGSLLVAQHPYRWAWDRQYLLRYLSFGWPLLVNGLLMYGILQGDRFVIGAAHTLFHNSVYTLTDLAMYSIAFLVTMAPSSLCVSVINPLFLPLLSRCQDSRPKFEKRYAACLQLAACCGLSIAIPSILICPFLIPWIYGERYANAGILVGWLGAMWGVRIFRASPSIAAISVGDTRTSMVANIVRSIAILGMLYVAAMGSSLIWIAICSFIGEVLATAVCLWRLNFLHKIRPALAMTPIAVLAVGTLAAGLASTVSTGKVAASAATLFILVGCAGLMLILSVEFRSNVMEMLGRSKSHAVAAP